MKLIGGEREKERTQSKKGQKMKRIKDNVAEKLSSVRRGERKEEKEN